MSMDQVFIYIKDNVTEFIAILALLVSILSQLLSMVEYFRLKGKWDFYFLDDIARPTKKSGFNPEYLATSLFIIALLFFVMTSENILTILSSIKISIALIFIITIIIFIFSFGVFYVFSRNNVAKKIQKGKEYMKFVIEKASFTTIKYFLQMILIYFIYRNVILKKYYLAIALLIISGFLTVFLEYYFYKIRTSRIRNYSIFDYDGKTYCILSTINSDRYYVVEAKINKDTINLFLDKRLIVNAEGKAIYEIKVKNIKRLYFNNEIKSNGYYLD